MLAEEYIKPWNDLYLDSAPPDPMVFLETYALMDDIKQTLDYDKVKLYSADWNDTLHTVEELSILVPSVSRRVYGRLMALFNLSSSRGMWSYS